MGFKCLSNETELPAVIPLEEIEALKSAVFAAEVELRSTREELLTIETEKNRALSSLRQIEQEYSNHIIKLQSELQQSRAYVADFEERTRVLEEAAWKAKAECAEVIEAREIDSEALMLARKKIADLEITIQHKNNEFLTLSSSLEKSILEYKTFFTKVDTLLGAFEKDMQSHDCTVELSANVEQKVERLLSEYRSMLQSIVDLVTASRSIRQQLGLQESKNDIAKPNGSMNNSIEYINNTIIILHVSIYGT